MKLNGIYIQERSHWTRTGTGHLALSHYWNVTDTESRFGYVIEDYSKAMKQAIWMSHFHRNGRVLLNAGRNI